MPLFPPVTDTLRWDDLVRQGRTQLPLLCPEWSDQNVSDPGIAVLELLAWLVEADSYRSSAVSDRERRLLLALAGNVPKPARAARCLVRVSGPPGTVALASLAADGHRGEAEIPLQLLEDVAVTGARIAALGWFGSPREPGGTREVQDLTREFTAAASVLPLGPDPVPGDAMLLGLAIPGGFPGGPLDLWFVPGSGTGAAEVPAADSQHHSAVLAWEFWDGSSWASAVAADQTAALTRPGRVRLTLPTVAEAPLDDQLSPALAGGPLVWLQCRLVSGRHDAAPTLAGLWSDAGLALAAAPYTSSFELPAGIPVSGAPADADPLPQAVVTLRTNAAGQVLAVRLDPPPADPNTAVPAVNLPRWVAPSQTHPGLLEADLTLLGVTSGVPDETLRLPRPWCESPPRLWFDSDGGPVPISLVADLAHAGPQTPAAMIEADGLTLRFGDGHWGSTLPPGATVHAAGNWTTASGVAEVPLPVTVSLPQDGRTAGLLGAAAPTTTVELVATLQPGEPPEDLPALAARAEAELWVHDRLTEAAARRGASSLDDLPLEVVRTLNLPERAVTALDVERLALATPGVALWRARALPQVDPRLPGLVADGCLTVVVIPQLPRSAPTPTAGALARVHAHLASGRTLGTRFFVVGPSYVRIGVQARVVPRPGVRSGPALAAAATALRGFLHPVTGGPSGRGWKLGRAVRLTEVLQLLDALPQVDRVEQLRLARELPDGRTCPTCGDVSLAAFELPLVGSIGLREATEVQP